MLVNRPRLIAFLPEAATVEEASDSTDCLPRGKRKGKEIAGGSLDSKHSLCDFDANPTADQTSKKCTSTRFGVERHTHGDSRGPAFSYQLSQFRPNNACRKPTKRNPADAICRQLSLTGRPPQNQCANNVTKIRDAFAKCQFNTLRVEDRPVGKSVASANSHRQQKLWRRG